MNGKSTEQPPEPIGDNGLLQHQHPNAVYVSDASGAGVQVGVVMDVAAFADPPVSPQSAQVHSAPELKEASKDVLQLNQQDAQIESLCEKKTSVDTLQSGLKVNPFDSKNNCVSMQPLLPSRDMKF